MPTGRNLVRGAVLTVLLALAGCATAPRETSYAALPSIWPVAHRERRITSPFGPRIHPITRRAHRHSGVDIAAPKGTPVAATADGVVLFTGRVVNYGRLVRIAHGRGLETWYAHLKDIGVKSGRRVRRGERIGRLGESGRTTGPHLHYEVRIRGAPVDPARYLP